MSWKALAAQAAPPRRRNRSAFCKAVNTSPRRGFYAIVHPVQRHPEASKDAQAIWFADKVRRAGFSCVADFAAHFDLKPYRLKQIYRAAAKELAAGVDDVTTLPKELRTGLDAVGFTFDSITPVVVQRSSDKQTSKGLFRL